MSKNKKPKNPVSDEKDSNRVLRGGYWRNYPYVLRSAQRFNYGPSNRTYNYGIGFRIVKNIPKDQKEKK